MSSESNITLKDLKKWVNEGEGTQLEFKLKTSHPNKIMREVVAFANTEGGKLLIGVNDNKELIGLKFPDEDRFVMEKAFKQYVSPIPEYTCKEIKLENGKIVLAYEIFTHSEQLYYYNLEAEEPKIYVRHKDRSIQASKEVKEILKQQLKHKNYRFHYGDKETTLVKYLDVHGEITLQKFAEIAQIPQKTASKTLILLVLAGLLQIIPQDGADLYKMKPQV